MIYESKFYDLNIKKSSLKLLKEGILKKKKSTTNDLLYIILKEIKDLNED